MFLQSKGFTARQMAAHFHCSASLIYTRLYAENLGQRKTYTEISDVDLASKVADLHKAYPNAGRKVQYNTDSDCDTTCMSIAL